MAFSNWIFIEFLKMTFDRQTKKEIRTMTTTIRTMRKKSDIQQNWMFSSLRIIRRARWKQNECRNIFQLDFWCLFMRQCISFHFRLFYPVLEIHNGLPYIRLVRVRRDNHSGLRWKFVYLLRLNNWSSSSISSSLDRSLSVEGYSKSDGWALFESLWRLSINDAQRSW